MKTIKIIILIAMFCCVVCDAVFAEDYFRIDKIDDPDIIVYAPVQIEEGKKYRSMIRK